MNFPSELPFASFLQYSPSQKGTQGAISKEVMYAIKSDGTLGFRSASGAFVHHNAIDVYTNAIARECKSGSFLGSFLGPDTVLVPVPRSAPLSSPQSLWVPRRICAALHARGLASDVIVAVERHTPVQKSAFAGKGKRPNPSDHFASTRLISNTSLLLGKRIILIDDVITRGSSFMGIFPHLAGVFPGADILCFALLRTESSLPVESYVAPVQGTIRFSNGFLQRSP